MFEAASPSAVRRFPCEEDFEDFSLVLDVVVVPILMKRLSCEWSGLDMIASVNSDCWGQGECSMSTSGSGITS